MSSVAIKICDVRTMEALQICKECDVDYIGLHLINPPINANLLADYRKIVDRAAPIKTVLLTRSVPLDDLLNIVVEIPFDYVQLHRPCSIEEIVKIKKSVKLRAGREIGIITVFEAKDCDFSLVHEMSRYADFVLFDSNYKGGTGELSALDKLKEIASNCGDVKYFIAGGLTPENVITIMRITNPYGVDVQTGVESAKHVKDYEKVKAFVDRVRSFV